MYGLFQTTFYFGYLGVFSLSLGILCGTVGYAGTRLVAIVLIDLPFPNCISFQCFCEENLWHSENRLNWNEDRRKNAKMGLSLRTKIF